MSDPLEVDPPVRPSTTLGGLGVRPVINASATLTMLGGSLMPAPVLKAMNDAAAHFVDLDELHTRVGERLAALTHNEAAYVTCGAAAAITLTVAACITDQSQAFPVDTEVVMFASQRNGYDYGVQLTGARIVEIGPSVDDLRAALARKPACVLWFAGTHFAAGALAVEDVIGVAAEAGVPVIVDAAAQIPPVSTLWRFTREVGADALILSGGKGLRGPQASGLVLGRRWIVDRCRLHASPNQDIGRGMKVGKEELLGLLAAVEWTLEQDEAAMLAGYERIVDNWIRGLQGLPGVTVTRGYPSEAGQPHSRAVVRLSPTSGWTRDDLVTALWDRDPRIAVGTYRLPDDAIALNPQTMEPGEEEKVLEALVGLLSSGNGEQAG
ncbi:aminotransferase class V-fold PLP-dependent enzyme [Kribbella sp. NPDC050241]|uniref:aminotransferase class V-fold PLP-dependent enzyme n=1 Tax=Kribbella sp. NPDC050241 TaxID=3364115 RepID=UPI0037A8F34C